MININHIPGEKEVVGMNDFTGCWSFYGGSFGCCDVHTAVWITFLAVNNAAQAKAPAVSTAHWLGEVELCFALRKSVF